MSDPHARRCAEALVETDLLLGLESVPRARGAGRPEPSPVSRFERPVNEAVETKETLPTTAAVQGTIVTATSDVASSSAPDAAPPLEPAIDPGAIEGGTPEERLAFVRSHHAAHCPQCARHDDCRSIVFGEGAADADLVFVGEAPGEQEDLAGRPFVGPAGELLDKMIAALSLDRSQVWITNVVKTRPPSNRTPRPDEAAACGGWLANELLVVRPKAIVALGGTPAKHLLGTTTGITRLRGVWASCRLGDVSIPVMPTFHPAFVLRQYTTDVRAAVWQDLQAAMAMASSD